MRNIRSSLRENTSLLIGVACVAALLALNLFRSVIAPEVQAAQEGAAAGGTHRDSALHNPNIQSFGQNHLEAQITREGIIRAFVLDQTAKGMTPLKTTALEAEVQPVGEDPVPVILEGKPLPGEPEGYCSQFTARVPEQLRDRPVGLRVNIRENAQSFRLHFAPEALAPDAFAGAGRAVDVAMPEAPQGSEEEKLFLTPGGIYTAEDIARNSSMTASRKYAGLMAQHSMSPSKGERICPITRTRADKRFVWVVGGKSYLFCCPPCVAEFVKQAREQPDQIRAPEAYVQR